MKHSKLETLLDNNNIFFTDQITYFNTVRKYGEASTLYPSYYWHIIRKEKVSLIVGVRDKTYIEICNNICSALLDKKFTKYNKLKRPIRKKLYDMISQDRSFQNRYKEFIPGQGYITKN